MKRAVVVVNPIAGRGRGPALGRRVVTGLARRGLTAEIVATGARGQGFTLPAAVDVVVAVGGDGTIRDALGALPDPAIPLAIVPAGTANVLAQDLGLPRSLERVLDVIAAGRTSALDVAMANGRLCIVAASAGLDAAAVHEVDRRRRGPISKLAYVGAVLRMLAGYVPPRLTVEVDGRADPQLYGLAIVANAINYGGTFRLCRHRRLDDGRFELYLVRDARIVRLAVLAAQGATAGLCAGARCLTEDAPGIRGGPWLWRLGSAVEVRRVRHVLITSAGPAPCQVDGDAAGHCPLDIAVEPARHRVVVP